MMPSIFTSTKFFNRPIDHQSTSNDRLKPVMTTGLVNMHIDWSIANLALICGLAASGLQGWAANFTPRIYRWHLPAWEIRLKWQIPTNIIFSCKILQTIYL